jgi:hypothetical protein
VFAVWVLNGLSRQELKTEEYFVCVYVAVAVAVAVAARGAWDCFAI